MADSISRLGAELRQQWLDDIEKVAARAVKTVIVQTLPAPPAPPLPDITFLVPQDRQVIAGNGLTGGGDLSDDRTFDVGAGDGIQVLTDSVAIKLHATVSGMVVDANGLRLGTPGTLAHNSTNLVSGSSHTHAITTSSNPGAAASILQSDASGYVTLVRFIATGLVSTPQVITASGNLALVPASGITDVADLRATTRLRTPLLDTVSGVMSIAPATHIELNPGSNLVNLKPNKVIQSENYASQTTGMRVSYSGEGDFRYLFADEMHVKNFIADLEQALAGGQIIGKSVAMLSRAFTVPAAGGAATIYLRDLPSAENMAVFQSGDIVRLRQFSRSGGSLSVTNAWGVVTSYTDLADKEQSWTFTRSSGGNAGAMSTGAVLAPDLVVLDYGTSGNGFYEVNAIDGMYGANSPYAQIVTWSTHPATGQVVNGRYGNLRGIFSVADEFGIYVGSGVTDADAYLRLSNLNARFNNVPIRMWDSGIETGRWESGGSFSLSDVSVNTANNRMLFFDAPNGNIRFGKLGANIGNLLWASSGKLALRMSSVEVITFDSTGDSYFSGRMTIGTSGEIVQGSGTLGSAGTWPAPPSLWGTFTGFRIGRSGSVGLWGLYASGLAQVYATTGGLLGFGGGKGSLDATGVLLLGYSYVPAAPWPPTAGTWPGTDPTRGYKFETADGHLLGGFTGTFSSTTGNAPLWMTVYLQNATGGDLYQWDFTSLGTFRSPGTVEAAAGSTGTGFRFTGTDVGMIGTNNYVAIERNADVYFVTRLDNSDSYLRLGYGNTNDRNAFIDLFGNGAAPTTYDARVIRGSGVNGVLRFENRGTGGFIMQQNNLGVFAWNMNGAEVMRIHTDQRVGIGTTAPAALLDVDGFSRALSLYADGDGGSVSGTTGFTNATAAGDTRSTWAGYIKAYVGTTTVYIPYKT